MTDKAILYVRPGFRRGKCHICREITEVRFCKLCGHWMDEPCSFNLAARALAAFRELRTTLHLGQPTPGCCGPTPPESEGVEV